ncbi:Acyl-CoA oxidase [Oesophagostomum dentatum]|uniref:Acyl-coenzyme A oxidase n=1 Tax=Oesophagostomum dentatum TaxID=61180 RepID=A0A0B1SYQ7_OESDE|nr:Acyl-CoA oxidase [Oesophagostomum dentatum]
MTSPLNEYRKRALFHWKNLKNIVEGANTVKIKEEIYAKLEKEPLFARKYNVPSLKELRELNHRRWKRIIELGLPCNQFEDLEGYRCLTEVLETYDQGLSARLALHSAVFTAALTSMGTKRHSEIMEKAKRNEVYAFYAKFTWTSFFSIVLLCCRDMETFEPLRGIVIGDMGEKPGAWNGVENGWMEFKNHRAPLWTLLNKGCDVTEAGTYYTEYKSSSEKQSVSLGALSVGRIGIIGKGVIASGLAATIGIRYSACRKQFGPSKGNTMWEKNVGKTTVKFTLLEEIPVLDYPLQQHRLFPFLAGHFTLRTFQMKLWEHFTGYMMRVMQGEKSEELAEFAKEIHALSSAAKPVATWFGVQALDQARQACGGHGFLQSSRLNELRDSFDPSQTFEGENHMILQQTSNILLEWSRKQGGPGPMKTFEMLKTKEPMKFKEFGNDIIEDVLKAYRWLIVYYLNETKNAFDEQVRENANDIFDARNNTQVHRAQMLGIAYAEHTAIQWAVDTYKEIEDMQIRQVLLRMPALYGLYSLEKHLASFYIGNYCYGEAFGEGIHHAVRRLEADLLPDAATLVDAIAPPDFVLNSALGVSTGTPYEEMMKEFRAHTNPKPDWWQDLRDFLKENSLTSKL